MALVIAGAFALTGSLAAQQTAATPPHHSPAGQHVMGFDLNKTVHHFTLYEDGGSIEVSVKDKTDKTNLEAIRQHLGHIALMFSQGVFEAPMMVHEGKTVPGIAHLAHMGDKVKYAYADTPTGGGVNIVTADKDALSALHAFLKFQIEDHKTGDKTAVMKRK